MKILVATHSTNSHMAIIINKQSGCSYVKLLIMDTGSLSANVAMDFA